MLVGGEHIRVGYDRIVGRVLAVHTNAAYPGTHSSSPAAPSSSVPVLGTDRVHCSVVVQLYTVTPGQIGKRRRNGVDAAVHRVSPAVVFNVLNDIQRCRRLIWTRSVVRRVAVEELPEIGRCEEGGVRLIHGPKGIDSENALERTPESRRAQGFPLV